MSTTTVGAGAATMAGTTHGYGTVVGDGTILTTVWGGDGTTHGDITVGAGEATSVGATLTMAGAGPVITAMDGAAIMAVTGTTHITIEDTMAETMLICQAEEGTIPVSREPH